MGTQTASEEKYACIVVQSITTEDEYGTNIFGGELHLWDFGRC